MGLKRLRDNFYPDTLALLEAAFNEAWEVVMTSGGDFDQGATRNALAELIISFAAEGAPSRKRSEAGGNYLAQDHCKPRHNVWRWWLFGGIAPSHDTEDQDAPDNQIDLRE